jgi:hypothetical protein
MLIGTNGPHAVGLFNVSINTHVVFEGFLPFWAQTIRGTRCCLGMHIPLHPGAFRRLACIYHCTQGPSEDWHAYTTAPRGRQKIGMHIPLHPGAVRRLACIYHCTQGPSEDWHAYTTAPRGRQKIGMHIPLHPGAFRRLACIYHCTQGPSEDWHAYTTAPRGLQKIGNCNWFEMSPAIKCP